MQQVSFSSEPKPEDPAYIQAMVNKADGIAPTDTPADQLLAGKYKTEEDLDKGISELLKGKSADERAAFYKQLEGTLGKPAAKDIPEPKDQASPAQDQKLNPADQLKVSPPDGTQIDSLDMTKYTQEFYEKGALSEETYKELTDKYKVSKETADAFIAGQQALAERFNGQVFAKVGGQEAYTSMLSWAATNLSPEEARAFNDAVDSGYASRDMAKVSLAVEALHARYSRANNSNPQLVQGNNSPSSLVGYASRAEMVRDINDPRYSKDEAFRESVRQKIAKSNL